MLVSNHLCLSSSFIGCAFWGQLEEQTGDLQPQLLCFDISGAFMGVPLRSHLWDYCTKPSEPLGVAEWHQGAAGPVPGTEVCSPPPLAGTLPFWYFASLIHSFPATESQVPGAFLNPHGKGIASACRSQSSALWLSHSFVSFSAPTSPSFFFPSLSPLLW